MKNITHHIVARCGGADVVARLAGVNRCQVSRWSRSSNGGRGLIPARHQHRILIGARGLGVALTPDDFFDLQTGDDPPA